MNDGWPLLGREREAFSKAARILATHPGRIQERLGRAFRELTLDRMAEFPEGELRTAYYELYGLMTRAEPKGVEGRFMASAMALSEEEAVDAARLILLIDYQIGEIRREGASG